MKLRHINFDDLMNKMLTWSRTGELLPGLSRELGQCFHMICLKSNNVVTYPASCSFLLTTDWIKNNLNNAHILDPAGSSMVFLPYSISEETGILMAFLDTAQNRCLAISDLTRDEVEADLETYTKLFLMIKLMLKQNVMQETEHTSNVNAFLDLLIEENNMTCKSLQYQARGLGLELPEAACYVVVARYSAKGVEKGACLSMEEDLQRFSGHFDLMNQNYSVLCGLTKRNDLFYIVPTKKVSQKEHIRKADEFIERIQKYLSNYFIDYDYSFGVGLPVENITHCHQSYGQAYKSLKHAVGLFGGESVLHYRNLGVFRLLEMPALKEHTKPFLMDYLNPVLSLGKEEAWPLLETVYAYVLCGLNTRECARRTFVHHNTVRYRLEKFTQQCNLDFKTPWQLVTILVCFEILNLCPEYGPDIDALKARCAEMDLEAASASR